MTGRGATFGLFVVLLATTAVACGDDGSSAAADARDGGAPGREPGLPDAGAGSGESSVPRSWPDSGLGSPVKELMCPSGPCEGAGGLAACCADDGSCGAEYLGAAGAGCVPIDGEGLLDPSCPSSGETFGCCRPSGFCGAFYTSTFGCVDPRVFPNPPEEEIPCTRTQ